MNKKSHIDAYKYFNNEAKQYKDNYISDDLLLNYPNHIYRLKIFLKLLNDIKPNRLLDIGCGCGLPLLSFLKEGYDAYGFDYSVEMVEQAKQLLAVYKYDINRVSHNNMEAISNISPAEYDCIVGLGTLYYSRNFNSTIKQVADILPKNGNLIFSLRNELFSLFSMNSYTAEYILRNFIPLDKLSDSLKGRIENDLDNKFGSADTERKFLTIDDKNVHSMYHNPLTVEKEILIPNGLSLTGLYYYHYHSLPPKYEHSDTEEFRQLSSELENASDWRGMFMCSTFVVHATKTI